MSRSLWRRIFFLAGTFFVVVLAMEGGKFLFFPNLTSWQASLLTIMAGFFGILVGGYLDERTTLTTSLKNETHQHLQADLLELNRELEARALTQKNELARLNVELSLEMAMHKQAEDIAQTREERFRNMAENIQEGLTIIEQGRLMYVNQRACEIFGKCPEGDLFHRIRGFALPEEQERLRPILEEATRTGTFPSELQYWIERKKGVHRCIREHYTSSIEGIPRAFVVTADITERVQAYQTLEQAVNDRTRELSTILDISKKIASTLELEPLLNLILDQIEAIIPYSGAAIFSLDEETLKVITFQVPGLFTPAQPLHLSLSNLGPYAPVILEKRVMVANDVHGEPPLARAFEESLEGPQLFSFNHAHSWIGIPLISREQVTGLLSLAHRQPGFYTPQHAHLAEAITHQIAMAIENARLYEKAQTLAALEERNRIARELHDSVTQLLYGITLYCSATTRATRHGNFAQVEENLAEIKEDALQALQEMRLLILELNPPLLQTEGFVAALQASLEAIENRAGLETELHTDGVGRLSRTLEPALYRIAMEALNNLVRYARAKKVFVNLSLRSGWIILEICDNGVGFDLTHARNNGGMGLHSMEQRAHQLGGRLEVTSSPGSGTHIRAEIPAQERWAQ